MSDGTSSPRREFLALAGSTLITATSGCQSSGSESTTTTGTTTGGIETSERTETTETTQVPPSVADLVVEYDDPQTTEKRTLTVTGSVSAEAGVEAVAVATGDASTTERFDGPSTVSFEASLDVMGGSEYEVVVTATDSNEASATERQETRYVGEPSAPVGDDRLVGVHYYGWWGNGDHWDAGYPGKPTLGEYDAQDPAVIEQHLEWCRQFGVNWLSLSWWGPDSYSNETFVDHVLPADALGDVQVSILYETTNRLEQDPGWNVDFDDEANREQFVEDVEYLADEYFGHDNYLRIDDKPVVYMYVAGGFIGDIRGAFDAAADAIGEELYVVADMPLEVREPGKADHMFAFDAVSNYTGFYEPVENVNERVPEYSLAEYRDWRFATADTDVDFIPGIMPGFDKTEWNGDSDNPVMERSPSSFRSWCNSVLDLVDPDLNAVLVTSFNEGHEYTNVEPSEEYGTTYMEILEEEFAEGDGVYLNLDAYADVVFSFDHTVAETELNSEADPRFARDLALYVDYLELSNPSTGYEKRIDMGEKLLYPYIGVGVYGGSSSGGKRWFGGQDGEAELFFDREDVARASRLTLDASAARDGDPFETTLSVDGTRVDQLTVTERRDKQYHFSLDPDESG
ncbi:hypothetical protein HALDL1_09485 [Halobacterium sp. DL1]|jgi:hypothetical protein|nr:hypothetical protein HALDL1_09485 [Halobacterium sp. DL1]